MKKLIGLSVIGLLVVALSGPVYAQLEFKASGFIDTNWMEYRNQAMLAGSRDDVAKNAPPNIYGPGGVLDPNGAAFNKTASWWNTRGLLRFDAAMGKDVSMTTFFEIDATRWGERSTGRNSAGDWQTDAIAVEVKNLFIDVGIPYFGIPVPMTARIGMQPLAVRRPMLISNDGAGITLGFKADPVTISPFYFKMSHAASAAGDRDYDYSDDNDVFGAQGTVALGTITIGAYGVLYNMPTYPLNVTTGYGTQNSFSARMWWFGAYADGKAGPVNLKADFVYDYGRVRDNLATDFRDVKFRGYAARLALVFPWEMFEFGLQGVYGSGSDTRKTSGTGLPGSHTSTGVDSFKVGSYVVPPGSEEPPAFGGESGTAVFFQSPILGRQPDFSNDTRFNFSRGSIGGVWLGRAHAAFKLAPWYKITLVGAYIGDTTKHGNTVGNALKANGALRDDKTIGWEVDLYNEFQVYKNVYFGVVGGWLFAKKALDVFDPVNGRNVSPKDPFIVGSMIKYTW